MYKGYLKFAFISKGKKGENEWDAKFSLYAVHFTSNHANKRLLTDVPINLSLTVTVCLYGRVSMKATGMDKVC